MRARRWSSRKVVIVALLGAVLVLILAMLPATASPAAVAVAQSQEAPSGSDASEEEGISVLESFQSLPVWVQATVVSAAASLTGFALIELVRLARRRWRRHHFGSNPPLIVQGLLPTVSGYEQPTTESRLAALGNRVITAPQTARDPTDEEPPAETPLVEEPVVLEPVVEEPILEESVTTRAPELTEDEGEVLAPADAGITPTPPDGRDEGSPVGAKVRIYELARELGLESKELLAQATALGLGAKAAISWIDDEAASLLRRFYAGKAPEAIKPDSVSGIEAEEESVVALVAAGPPTASVPEDVSVGDLALVMGQEADAILKELLKSGIPASPTDSVPSDLIGEIADTFGYTITIQSAEPEPAPVVEPEPVVAIEAVAESVPEPVAVQEEPIVDIEVDLTPASEGPSAAPEPIPEMSEGLSPRLSGADTPDTRGGSGDVVVDLTRFEESTLPPESELSPNGPPIELALAGAVSSERSGLLGSVRNAFRNRGGHVHRFVEAPAGKGLVRQICSQCGYVSIGVVSSRSEHSPNGPDSSS